MAQPSVTTTLNTINSITLPLIAQKIADNITGRIPLWFMLNKIGNKEYESGGIEYRFPIMNELTASQAYTGLTPLNTVERDPVISAILYRKQFTEDITLSGTKLLQNSGDDPTAVIPYLTAQIEMAEERLKNTLAGSSLGIFSDEADGDLGITGLQTMLPATYTAGTYAGLDRATYTEWRSQYDSVATGFNTDGYPSMINLQLACVRGDEAPSVIITTRATYANLARFMTGTISFNVPFTSPNTQFGDLSFQHINFFGSIVIFDDGVPANTAYFLNLKYLKLLVHRDRDFSVREFIAPNNQDAITGRIFWSGNIVCNNLARQGHLSGSPDTW